MNTNEQKFRTVIDKNTFYFFNKEFEESYEGYIGALKNTLLAVQHAVAENGLRREIFEELLAQKEHGLRALLALTGVSNENLKRLTTIIRATDDAELGALVCKNEWAEDAATDALREWSDAKIAQLVSDNAHFRRGLVRLFFEGAGNPFLARTLPLFELKKFSMEKLRFELAEMVDTIIRYKEKGSYSGRAENNPEYLIHNILAGRDIPFVGGDLEALVSAAPNQKTQDGFHYSGPGQSGYHHRVLVFGDDLVRPRRQSQDRNYGRQPHQTAPPDSGLHRFRGRHRLVCARRRFETHGRRVRRCVHLSSG